MAKLANGMIHRMHVGFTTEDGHTECFQMDTDEVLKLMVSRNIMVLKGKHAEYALVVGTNSLYYTSGNVICSKLVPLERLTVSFNYTKP